MRCIILLMIGWVLIFAGCEHRPEYPNVPSIAFRSVERYLKDGGITGARMDSVVIRIDFKDGDGDLGLPASYKSHPYHQHDLARDGNGKYILIGSNDTLPPYSNCHYDIGNFVPDNPGVDTVLKVPNPNHFNYFIEYYVKKNGEFQKLDLGNRCQSTHGRFAPLSPKEYAGPIEGILTYTIYEFFEPVFKDQTLKFRIQIQDRALNRSNTIETSEVVFRY